MRILIYSNLHRSHMLKYIMTQLQNAINQPNVFTMLMCLYNCVSCGAFAHMVCAGSYNYDKQKRHFT